MVGTKRRDGLQGDIHGLTTSANAATILVVGCTDSHALHF